LDYETNTSHSVTVLATSTDGSTSSQAFTINVTDVNESPVGAISDTDVAADYVLENSANGTTVGVTAHAADPDGTDTVTYSLDNDADGRFTIDSNTGVITVAGAIDREAAGIYDVTVRATSSDGSYSSATFTITIGDVDDFDGDGLIDTDETDNEDKDSDVDVPTYENQADDSFADEEPVAPVEEYLITEDSFSTDDSLVFNKNSKAEESEEIIYLTDENDTDIHSDRRENDDSYIYFDNDLYKEINSSKYLDLYYASLVKEPTSSSVDEIVYLDFESNDTAQLNINGDYDLLRHEIDESYNSELKSQSLKTKILSITSTSFTVGIISYLLRAGSMMTSLISSLPLWRGFDPIAVFIGNKKKQKGQNKIPNTEELKSETLFDGDQK
jgi:hypothetical protein